MPSLPELVEARASGSELAISNEPHVVGEDSKLPGTNYVLLNEVPLESTGVTISGFTEVTGTPASGEFRAFYPPDLWAGLLEFHASAVGSSIQASYDGMGSTPAASWLNRVRQKLQGIKTLTDATTVTVSLKDELKFYLNLTANGHTIGSPSDMEEGLEFVIFIESDGFTVSWHADYDFGSAGAPTLTATANKFDALGFIVRSSKPRFSGFQAGYSV